MDRFNQDAAEELYAHEVRLRRPVHRRPPTPMGEPWRPTITEQERQEREQQIAAGELPF